MHGAPWMLALVLLFGPGIVRADDNPQQLLELAITAHGGEANLAKYPARTWKAKGNVHVGEKPISFTGEWANDGIDKMRWAIQAKDGEQQFQFVNILNGEQGWRKTGDNVMALSEQELTNERNAAHLTWVARLVPLKDKAYTLTMLKEITVDNRPAVGFNVARQGYKEVKLYFDKQTRLLVKAEYQSFDIPSSREIDAESLLSDHKEVQGVKVPMKTVYKRQGTVFVETENTEVKFHEKLDAGIFKKPE
jgi:hypothetical protein